MVTSRFQLGLIATLALGLGLSLASTDAIGYPAGSAVSLGTNPVVSAGVTIHADSSSSLITAGGSHDLVVTDLILSINSNAASCWGYVRAALSVEGGSSLGTFSVGVPGHGHGVEGGGYSAWAEARTNSPTIVPIHFGSGIRVEAGKTLDITASTRAMSADCASSTVDLDATVSGYYAQP
jgi:hypothetical protein